MSYIPVRKFRSRLSEEAIGAMAPVTTPSTRAIEKLKKFFETELTRNQLYIALVDLDSELDSAISTAGMIIDRCMKGFSLKVGKKLEREEEELLIELRSLDKILRPYIFDIATKLIRDGDACYLVDVKKGQGITGLRWLPIDQLTILESKDQMHRFSETVQEDNWYCLNEVPSEGLAIQWFKKEQIVHFNWDKQEKIKDRFQRSTVFIYNDPPLEALATDLLWKLAIKINDILWREVNVPREQHKVPSAPYDPSLFDGATQEERIKKATEAAESALEAYAKKLAGRRVDRGYVTLDNVAISIIESRLQYTAPNELLRQINDAIYGAVGAPESAVSGRTRATYAGEIAVESYLLLKSEFLAQKIASRFIELAKRHLTVKVNEKFKDHYDKIDCDVQLIFFPREMARTIAILRETGIFAITELREMFGKGPLSEEQARDLALPVGHKFTETGKETATTERRREEPGRPETPQSESQRQVT